MNKEITLKHQPFNNLNKMEITIESIQKRKSKKDKIDKECGREARVILFKYLNDCMNKDDLIDIIDGLVNENNIDYFNAIVLQLKNYGGYHCFIDAIIESNKKVRDEMAEKDNKRNNSPERKNELIEIVLDKEKRENK